MPLNVRSIVRPARESARVRRARASPRDVARAPPRVPRAPSAPRRSSRARVSRVASRSAARVDRRDAKVSL